MDHHHDHFENDPCFKGLKVTKGVSHQESVSRHAAQRLIQNKKKSLAIDEYMAGIESGDITILSRAVTLLESSRPDHQEMAQEIIKRCLPMSGRSIRLGITGVPGAGKSTTIEALGMHIIGMGGRLAVLAIDPSSERSKGSILGDKTRMEQLAGEPNAYIRPSPSAGSLGGVARKTRETIVLCEAAGFDHIIVETVGVGQSETAVHSMVDFFLLLQLAGAGDELQGIKRGIMEMADGITINKADGSNIEKAKQAQTNYRSALHLFPASPSGWIAEVITSSALEKTGIDKMWDMVLRYVDLTQKNSYFYTHRRDQARYWMFESINETLRTRFYSHPVVENLIGEYEQMVLQDKKSSFVAANDLLEIYYKNL